MNRYRIETVFEYVSRGGTIRKLKATKAVTFHSKPPSSKEAAIKRIERWVVRQ